MQRSSKIILAVCAALLVLIVAYFVPLFSESKPEFNEKDSKEWLSKLGDAFARKNVNDVVSFAYPDAVIAGRTLRQMEEYLRRGVGQTQHLAVEFTDVDYHREGNRVTLNTNTEAGEKAPEAKEFSANYYNHRITFTVERRATPQLGGLFRTYEWKATAVDAGSLPNLDNP